MGVICLGALGLLIVAAIWRQTHILLLAIAMLLAVTLFEIVEKDYTVVRDTDGQITTVTGTIMRREMPTEAKQRLYVRLHESMSGIRLVTVDLARFPEYGERQVIRFECEQQPPTSREETSALRNRYAKGIGASCVASNLMVIDDRASCLRYPLLCGRFYIVKQIETLWPRPIRSLVLGLLLGDKADFPKQVLDQFSAAGISHIIALSGFNITVIIVCLEALALRLMISKRWRPYAIIAMIALFTVFVGSAASIVRAACMGSLALWGKSLGRRPSATRLLLISAAAMTLANPYTLLYDVGFQLSCCATFGLLAFSEWFEARLWFIPARAGLRGSLSTTLAASLPTIPLLLYTFGTLSIISPLTNMLVLPLIPHIMWTGALAVLVSVVSPSLAALIANGVSRACQYILDISAWAASVSWAAVPMQITLTTSLVLSLAILLFSRYVQKTMERA